MPNDTIETMISLIQAEVKDKIRERVRGDRNQALIASATTDLISLVLRSISDNWDNPTMTALTRDLDNAINNANVVRKLVACLANKYDAYLIPHQDYGIDAEIRNGYMREFVYTSSMDAASLRATLQKAKVHFMVEYNMAFPSRSQRKGDLLSFRVKEVFVVGKWIGEAIEAYARSSFSAMEMYEYIKRMKPDDYDMNTPGELRRL